MNTELVVGLITAPFVGYVMYLLYHPNPNKSIIELRKLIYLQYVNCSYVIPVEKFKEPVKRIPVLRNKDVGFEFEPVFNNGFYLNKWICYAKNIAYYFTQDKDLYLRTLNLLRVDNIVKVRRYVGLYDVDYGSFGVVRIVKQKINNDEEILDLKDVHEKELFLDKKYKDVVMYNIQVNLEWCNETQLEAFLNIVKNN